MALYSNVSEVWGPVRVGKGEKATQREGGMECKGIKGSLIKLFYLILTDLFFLIWVKRKFQQVFGFIHSSGRAKIGQDQTWAEQGTGIPSDRSSKVSV